MTVAAPEAVTWAGPVDLPLGGESDVQAACGLMHVHGRRYGRPTRLGLDYASITASELAGIGAVAVELARARGLALRAATTSVAQAALLTVSQYLAAATAERWPEPYLPGGPPFVSADGVPFEVEALEAEVWRRFWAALDAPDRAVARGWRPFQHRFATATCPLPVELTALTGRTPIHVLENAARSTGMSLVRVASRAVDDLPAYRVTALGDVPARPGEASAPPPGEESGRSSGEECCRSSGETPGRSSGEEPGRSSGEGCGPSSGEALPSSACGWSARGASGWSAADAPAVPPGGALPLSGLVVLESCRRVQGPLAGHLLGLLGASVVRIEPPGGDPARWVPPVVGDGSARFLALNRGKRVEEVDLGTVAGRREALELASAADVFLHDWAPGKAAAWALRAGDVARARPGVVYAHASGWGDALGPEPPLGTDFVVQAHAGVPPSLMTIVEVFGGVVAVRGIVDALLRRARTGRGQAVDSSLLAAASRLNARSRGRCAAPLRAPVCTDLAELARDPRFARALVRDGCVFPASPWEFAR
ncbi:CoA transferase [Saccharothrix australiensis]|uniref:CoA transferase family III n=1 Tax=Saccharothrix australiensis TaxID=2072 RepID=A0A495W2D6_9PSEU|nr:CoA transferase [Saccharothrix australiensis]RKT54895.1 CoA transferase family III [Saccharothrix australiensis]